MKKLVVMMAALLLAVSAYAQLGITAGVTSNATDIKSAYADIVDGQNITLYHAGVVLRLGLPFGLAVQPGIIYNMKGEALSKQIASKDVKITTKTGYLEVPVQVQWGINFADIVRPYVFVEPYLGYAVTEESKAEAQSAADRLALEAAAAIDGKKLDGKNNWEGRERLEYGVGAGVGVQILKRVGVSAKYYWDMGKMYNEEGKSTLSASAMYEATQNQECSGIVASVIFYF